MSGSSALALLAATAAVPVLLHADGAGLHAERDQLRSFAQAALQLGETWEAGQADDVVPQLSGPVGSGSRLITGPKDASPSGGSK